MNNQRAKVWDELRRLMTMPIDEANRIAWDKCLAELQVLNTIDLTTMSDYDRWMFTRSLTQST